MTPKGHLTRWNLHRPEINKTSDGTSVNQFNSIFGHILQIFSKQEFQAPVKEQRVKRTDKGTHPLGTVCYYTLLPSAPSTFT
jgi:hypothetical protein